MALSALDERGKPVDWWFLYKVAGKSTTSTGAKGPTIRGNKVTGVEYVYADANAPRIALSPNTLDRGGALPRTLGQIYGSKRRDLGWFFYNDENPINGKVNYGRGHTKGVLAFDLSTDTAFWLIQSTPKFPPKGGYAFPKSGTSNAQSMLCITLKDAGVARSIARQMYVAQQPNVYLASAVPAELASDPNDPRVKLMKDQVAAGSTPVHVVLPFRSRGGVKLTSIAKNRTWGLDFYNDLVGPTLGEDLEVETWEHDPVPRSPDSDKQHTVVDAKEVDLGHLGIDLAWSEAADHAKIAISAAGERVHYVCVGDINYTIAQRKRGGGTVAFRCDPLWTGLASILERTADFAGVAASAPAAARKAAPRKAAARRGAPSEPAPDRTAKHAAAQRTTAGRTTARRTSP